MALGEDAPLVVGALAGELSELLGLADCEYVVGPPAGDRPWVAPDGSLVTPAGAPVIGPGAAIDLPVWEGDRPVGRYRMVLGPGSPPDPDRWRAAAGLADQAAAALASYRPVPEPGPDGPGPGRIRRLRIVR